MRAFQCGTIIRTLAIGLLCPGMQVLCAAPASAVSPLAKCALIENRLVRVDVSENLPALKVDIIDDKHRLLGRQTIIKPPVGESGIPLLSLDWGRLPAKSRTVECARDDETRFTRTGFSIDVGPDIDVSGVYFGDSAMVISLYASGVGGPLFDQVYYVQLDRRTPYEVQITATKGQDFSVRFEGVSPGEHHVTISYLSYMPPSMNAFATKIGDLEATMPSGILGSPQQP